MGRSTQRDLREGAASTVLKDPSIILFKNGSSLVIVLIPHQIEGILEKTQFLTLFLSGYTFLLSVHSLIYTHTVYLQEGVKGEAARPQFALCRRCSRSKQCWQRGWMTQWRLFTAEHGKGKGKEVKRCDTFLD